MQNNNAARPTKYFWITSSSLFVLAVILRWVRLDLMMFRYDQAEVAFRCMETFRSGLPLTGIVNSLGFRNAGGYVWTVLPAFLISPDPRWGVAWHGLLTSTMIFPLVFLGRRYRNDALAWLPAVLAAVTPLSVFAGRNLWAQYLLPPICCWALLWLDTALRPEVDPPVRVRRAAMALGFLAWATSIHFSAAPLLLIAAGFVISIFRGNLKQTAVALIPAVLICFTILPSLLDWWDQYNHPRAKPEFVAKVEASLPPPFPWWMRLQIASEGVLLPSTVEAVSGIAIAEPGIASGAAWFDLWILIITAAGSLALLFRFYRPAKMPSGNFQSHSQFKLLLLAWLVLPIVIGGLFVTWVNAGYFLGSAPAVWLLPLFIAQSKWGRLIGKLFLIVIFVFGIALDVAFISVINRWDAIPGGYYIKYSQQFQAVKYIAENGVPPRHFRHLAGDWFGRSYAYIDQYVINREPDKAEGYALIQDTDLEIGIERRQLMEVQNPGRFGGQVVMLFPLRGAAEIWAEKYYSLPPD